MLHPGGPAPETAWWSVGHSAGPSEDPEATQPIALQDVPLTRTGRPARAPRPGALPPARAVAGAAVAVAGVALGIGTLLWATEPPAGDPAVRPAQAAAGDGLDEPAVEEPAAPAPQAPAAEAPAPPPPAPVQAAPAEAAPAPAAAPAADLVVPVLVLNNSRIDGLAEQAARQFEAAGWPVRDTGGLRGRIRATTVYYPPGEQDSATEFARRFDGVERVLPRLAELPGTGLTVVVTRDFVGQ